MFPTLARCQIDIARSIQKALPRTDLPPALRQGPGNLYQVLSRYADVKGKIVTQTRWSNKGISGSYWRVERARFKCEGNHGKAWGIKYWKGACWCAACIDLYSRTAQACK